MVDRRRLVESNLTREREERQRKVAFQFLKINLTISTLLVAGLSFVAQEPRTDEFTPYINWPMSAGVFTLVSSTVLAILVIVETTFNKTERNNSLLQQYVPVLVAGAVVIGTWSLPLFAIGVIVGMYEHLPTALRVLSAVMIYAHLVPTVYLFYRARL